MGRRRSDGGIEEDGGFIRYPNNLDRQLAYIKKELGEPRAGPAWSEAYQSQLRRVNEKRRKRGAREINFHQ